MSKIVYVAQITTDSGDRYSWVYETEPTRDRIIQDLVEWENAAEPEWYAATTSIFIQKETIRS